MARAGEAIGPYRLLARLGAGAMGEVWRARDERLDRYVAMKLLPPSRSQDVARRARLLREAKASAAVPHANVVTLFDIVQTGERDGLVMELVDGETLADRVKRGGAMDADEATRILCELGDALAAAHARGILHRDIKSANVMLAADGTVKVLDFGLAKLRDALDAPAPVAVPPARSRRDVELDATLAPRGSVAASDIELGATAAPPPKRAPAAPGENIELGATAAPPADSIELGATAAPPSKSAPASDDIQLGATAAPPTADLALERTLASGSGAGRGSDPSATEDGSLLGTPMYMSPEQVAGEPPDERSEVFSVGVVAYELLHGKTPYDAATLDELFAQIAHQPVRCADHVPAPLCAVLDRAVAKDPAERWASMAELRDAVAAVRHQLFAPRRARWPLALAALVAAALSAAAVFALTRAEPPPPTSPGDRYVDQALREYNLFYADKAATSLRGALEHAPDHPLAHAYLMLLGAVDDADRQRYAANATRVLDATPAERRRERALLRAAITLARRGPAAAAAVLADVDPADDPELAFWAAELSFRAGHHDEAGRRYDALLALDRPDEQAATQAGADLPFRGRLYDHHSAVLLYQGRHREALVIGAAYAAAFPGEPDALGVHATTLALAGKLDQALARAEQARRLHDGEDTLAGLAKVHAYRGDLDQARALYAESLRQAGPARRPARRAALAFLALLDGDPEAAARTTAPCLPGGDDAREPTRGACLYVAGLATPELRARAIAELDALAAAATPLVPARGNPAALAAFLRLRAAHDTGCPTASPTPLPPGPDRDALLQNLTAANDFYATYHVPLFAAHVACERAALGAPAEP